MLYTKSEAPPVVANEMSADETRKLIEELCEKIDQALRGRTQHPDLTKRIGTLDLSYAECVPDDVMEIVVLRLRIAGWDCHKRREVVTRGIFRRRHEAQWQLWIYLEKTLSNAVIQYERRQMAQVA